MKWEKGCPRHPQHTIPEDFKYHPVRGWICKTCGTTPTYLQASTVKTP